MPLDRQTEGYDFVVHEGILSIYPIDRSQNGNNEHINLVISVRHNPLKNSSISGNATVHFSTPSYSLALSLGKKNEILFKCKIHMNARLLRYDSRAPESTMQVATNGLKLS